MVKVMKMYNEEMVNGSWEPIRKCVATYNTVKEWEDAVPGFIRNRLVPLGCGETFLYTLEIDKE